MVVKLLGPLSRCIAGNSHLERLDIKSLTKKVFIVGIYAPEFIHHVLSTHSQSILKLKIPIIHPSSFHLQLILSSCKHLRALWIGTNRELMVNGFSNDKIFADLYSND
jgi:hypothetical protein